MKVQEVILKAMAGTLKWWEAAEIIGVNDIASEPLIMLTVDEIEENTGKLLIALGARPHVAFRTRSVEAVRSLVATGAGIALLPDLVYRPWSLEGDRIESRDVSGSLPVVQDKNLVGIITRSDILDFVLANGSKRQRPRRKRPAAKAKKKRK